MTIPEIIKRVQQRIGEKPDGIAGPNTWNGIAKALGVDLTALSTPPATSPSPTPQTPAGEAVDARSEGNIKTLDPKVQPLARKFIQTLVAQGIDARIIDGSRTYAQQDALYAQGRTKLGNIVTNARGGQSWHCFAVAFDIGIFENGKYLDDSPLYGKAGPIGESLGFEWGGRWKSPVDFPHYQFNPNKVSLAQARALHDQGKSIFV